MTNTEKGSIMQDIESLKAIYEEKQSKYNALCDAVATAYQAHQAIKEMCDKAMEEMHQAGEQLINAMNQ